MKQYATTYRTEFPPRTEWLVECARQGYAYRPHRAVASLPMHYVDAIAWAIGQFDPFQRERAS